MASFTFTSESVTEGHPDKMADQISDAVLDALLEQDPASRVACETLVTTGLAMIAGEITTSAYVDIPGIVRKTICEIGYDNEAFGYDGNTCGVMVAIDEQSPDIAQGVDASEEVRSGEAGGHQRLAGHTRGRILLQQRVEDRVGDLVGHLVRVTLGHRLGCEREGSHLARSPMDAWPGVNPGT